MAKVPTNDVVSPGYSGPDRRRGNFVGRVQRLAISCMRSRWLAMFVIAFAVSWSFHYVEKHADQKIERNQAIIECTVSGVAKAQDLRLHTGQRVIVHPILKACTELVGKK